MTDDELERHLQERLHQRAARVHPRPGGWVAIERRVRPARRRALVLALPAMALAAVAVVVGLVVLADEPGAGGRVRTNPALPGEGPGQPSTTERPDDEVQVVLEGGFWDLLHERREEVGGCLQLAAAGTRAMDPTFCGATESELGERGVSLAFGAVQPRGGAPTTVAPVRVVYGFVPGEASEVVLTFDRWGASTYPTYAVVGGMDVFGGAVPSSTATHVVVYDGDGRILYEEDLRGAD